MAKKPNIRFVGFEDDWEQRKLGATNTFFTDGNYGEAYPKLSDMTDSGSGVPFLTGGNLKDGKLSLDGASYITPEKHSKLTSGHLLEDDIVIAVRGSLGALGYVNTDNSGWNINSQLAILRTDKSELYGKFLIQYLLSWTGQNELLKRQTGSALKQLPIGAIKDVEVPITSIAEQEKIGEYFADLDNLITLHQRKCDELKKVKKFMLQKMFPKKGEKNPEIRFDGFTNDWEQRKFIDIATRGSSVCTSASDIPSVEYEDVVAEEGRLNKDIRSKEVVKSGITFDGSQVLYGKLRPYLHNWLNPDFNGVAVGDWWVLKPINVDKNFLYRLIQTQQFDNIANQSSGSKMPRADWNLISNSEFMVPLSKKEQSKIGRYFDNLDNLITLHQRKCEELKNVKKYMLQNMFAK